jgi:hypothetical protein
MVNIVPDHHGMRLLDYGRFRIMVFPIVEVVSRQVGIYDLEYAGLQTMPRGLIWNKRSLGREKPTCDQNPFP